MRAERALPILILVLCVLFGGCSPGFDDEDMLRPPTNTGRETAIQKLIEESSGRSYSLKYPKSGEYRSAIITKDLNADENEEAIAFFRTSADDSVRMLVMCSVKDEWKICTDFKTDYKEVDCIRFSDYNFDGTLDILAGFTTSGDTNELNVFSFNYKKAKAERVDFTANYSVFTTGDYDADGGSEIIALTLSSAQSEASASLIDFDNNSLYILSQCSMDSSVTKYENVTSGLISDSVTAAAVDGVVEGGFNTQILYYNKDERALMNYPHTFNTRRNPMFRSINVKSCDINDDKTIDFPVVHDNSDIANAENIAPIISWRSFDPYSAKLNENFRCIINSDYGYYFKMPDYFIGNTSATLSKDKKTLKILIADGDKKGSVLLTIKVFDVGASSDKMKNYTTLESYNQYTFAYKIGDTTILYADDDIVKENFALSEISA